MDQLINIFIEDSKFLGPLKTLNIYLEEKGNEIGIFYGSDKNLALELEKMIREDKDIDELILTEINTEKE